MTNSKLIYIEDDQILGNLITQALVDYGFEIDFRTTLNGLQESLASMLPDLLILDIEVNNQSCLDILPAIRSQYLQLPIIIASSHTNGAKIIRSYDAGANHYIKKPYDVTELVFQIQNLLQQSEKQLPAIWKIGTYQVDTRKQLLEEIWGNDSSEESLNNIISQLRKNSGQTNTFISVHTRYWIPIGFLTGPIKLAPNIDTTNSPNLQRSLPNAYEWSLIEILQDALNLLQNNTQN